MPLYKEAFPLGTRVRVIADPELREFRARWKYHHELRDDQMAFAGRDATVADVSYYHGGDVLYGLTGVPGLWHEECLRAASTPAGGA
jgi:hypothetical protein